MEASGSAFFLPETVEEAVDWLIGAMSYKDRVRVARLDEEELTLLHKGLGTFIPEKFGLWSGNIRLMRSCKAQSGMKELHEDSASAVIIRVLWEQLKATHSLRPVWLGL